jgi:putative hemolysin
LVGEMEDEFDVSPRRSRSGQDEVLLLDGSVNLRDLEVQMHWQLPRDGGIETLAGFLLARLGKIPSGGESVDYDGRRYTVVEMSGRRISRVRIAPIPPAPTPPANTAVAQPVNSNDADSGDAQR